MLTMLRAFIRISRDMLDCWQDAINTQDWSIVFSKVNWKIMVMYVLCTFYLQNES